MALKVRRPSLPPPHSPDVRCSQAPDPASLHSLLRSYSSNRKYPKIISRVLEDDPQRMEGVDGEEVVVPVDISSKNPNGEEFDNLYLDVSLSRTLRDERVSASRLELGGESAGSG